MVKRLNASEVDITRCREDRKSPLGKFFSTARRSISRYGHWRSRPIDDFLITPGGQELFCSLIHYSGLSFDVDRARSNQLKNGGLIFRDH